MAAAARQAHSASPLGLAIQPRAQRAAAAGPRARMHARQQQPRKQTAPSSLWRRQQGKPTQRAHSAWPFSLARSTQRPQGRGRACMCGSSSRANRRLRAVCGGGSEEGPLGEPTRLGTSASRTARSGRRAAGAHACTAAAAKQTDSPAGTVGTNRQARAEQRREGGREQRATDRRGARASWMPWRGDAKGFKFSQIPWRALGCNFSTYAVAASKKFCAKCPPRNGVDL